MSARPVLVNAGSLLVGRVFGAVVALVVAAVSAHRLDVAGFGLFASVLAAGFLANTLVTFGTDTVITRAEAAERPDAWVVTRGALTLQVLIAAVLIVAAGLACALGTEIAVFVQAVALVPMALVTVAGAVLRGRQRMDQLLVGSVLGGIATLVGLAGGFAFVTAVWVPVAALGIGSAVNGAVLVWYSQLSLVPVRGSSLQRAKALGSEAAPFAAMVVLAAIGAQVGVLLVEFASDDSAGGYGVAVRLSEAARLLPAAAMGAFFPAMLSGLHRTERYRRWLRWLAGYAVTATLALVVLAGSINRLVFDDQPDGARLTQILALGLVVTVLRLAVSFELIAGGRESVVLLSAFAGATVTIVGGLLMAKRFGAEGVAWSQLAGLVVATAVLIARSQSDKSLGTTEPAGASAIVVREVDARNGQVE